MPFPLTFVKDERLGLAMRLDALDAGLLTLLQEDARLSYRQLAERLGSTTPTVSARVKALEDLGILQGYRAEVDHSAFGGALHVLTVRTPPARAAEAARAVAALPGAEEVLLLAGGVVLARLRLRPPEATAAGVHAALAGMEHVLSYDLAEVLATPHRARPRLDPAGLDVRCHQCGGPIHDAPVRGAFGGRPHVFCCTQCHAAFKARYEAMAADAPGRPKAGKGRVTR